MQGDTMHDDARRQDDAKKKRTNNSNIGDFSGSLHTTIIISFAKQQN
jgi:hypothetical protein